MHGVIDKYAIVLAWGWSLDAAWALRVTRRRYEEHVMRRKEQGQQVKSTRRRLIPAGAMRQWWPRLNEVNLEARQIGESSTGLRTRVLQETGRSWKIIPNCSKALTTVNRTAVRRHELR